MQRTNITWAHWVFNPVSGCTKNCSYCYARKMTYRFPNMYPNGFQPTCYPEKLNELDKWYPKQISKPTKHPKDIVFVCSMSDLFDPHIPDEFIIEVLDKCAWWWDNEFMFLTKRPERLNRVYDKWCMSCEHEQRNIDHLHFGFTATNQKMYEESVRESFLFDFVSFEPLLEGVEPDIEWEHSSGNYIEALGNMKLMIVGGITPGKPLHETHPEWLEEILFASALSGVPVHYKHQGTNPRVNGQVYDWLIDGRRGK